MTAENQQRSIACDTVEDSESCILDRWRSHGTNRRDLAQAAWTVFAVWDLNIAHWYSLKPTNTRRDCFASVVAERFRAMRRLLTPPDAVGVRGIQNAGFLLTIKAILWSDRVVRLEAEKVQSATTRKLRGKQIHQRSRCPGQKQKDAAHTSSEQTLYQNNSQYKP